MSLTLRTSWPALLLVSLSACGADDTTPPTTQTTGGAGGLMTGGSSGLMTGGSSGLMTGGTGGVVTGGTGGVVTGGTAGTGGDLTGGTGGDLTGGAGGDLTGGTGGDLTGGTGGDLTGGTGGATGGSGGTGGDTGGTGGTTGICPAGPFPAPDLTGTLTPVWTSSSGFLEGPVWVASVGALFFSNLENSSGVQPSAIHRLTPPSTVTEDFVPASGSNGLAVNAADTIAACTHDDRAISTFDPTSGARGTILTTTTGLTFNSPNDLTIHSNGTIYFTDPNWQSAGRGSATGVTGIYRAAPSADAILIDGSRNNPNGIALSPDETVLYVGAADGEIRSYPVSVDGSVGAGTAFITGLNGPDGLGVDCAGNIYVAVNGGRELRVYAPGGASLGSIAVSGTAPAFTNVAFGGADRQTLYVTGGTTLYSKQMNLPGYPY